MDLLAELAAWAWARHHNPLSWYIRPLLLLPFCYFAWRRNSWGIAATVIALLTSMAWFPAPDMPDPLAVEFLARERDYLLGAWTPLKILFAVSIPAFLLGLAAAFWNRSWRLGLLIANLGGLTKVWWSFHFGGESGWTVVPAAIVGLIVLNGVVLCAVSERSSSASRD